MLPRKHRLSKKEFNIAFKQKGQFFKKEFLKLKVVENNLGFSRFGISCGVKISKLATRRNLVKRRISEALRTNLDKFNPGHDIIVMPEPRILEESYQQIEELLVKMISEVNIQK